MQFTTIGLATFILIFSIFTAYGSVRKPKELVRLVYMRAKLGNTLGLVLHTIIYVVVPAIFGGFMMNAGINGESITQFITQ
jgi:hypothetical protein